MSKGSLIVKQEIEIKEEEVELDSSLTDEIQEAIYNEEGEINYAFKLKQSKGGVYPVLENSFCLSNERPFSFHFKQHGKLEENLCNSLNKTNLETTPHSKKLYECGHCSYSGPVMAIFMKHLGIHSDEKPFKCRECSFASYQKKILMSHIRTHAGEKPFRCEFCSYSSSSESCFKKHFRRHTCVKPFKCEKCS
ncbi:UNVERIFIED_CONTAM: hypothetical protein GTU68_033570, partial [Idotea baltica]|nr:hypothetical protein [Idotea baltica]